jgi:hypothetical protein
LFHIQPALMAGLALAPRHLACKRLSGVKVRPEAGIGTGRRRESANQTKDSGDIVMSLKQNVKGVLTKKVRFGFFTVPVWVVGAVFLTRWARDRRRYA